MADASKSKEPATPEPVTTPFGKVIKKPVGTTFVKALQANYAHPFIAGLRFPKGEPKKVTDLGKDQWLHAQIDAEYFVEVDAEEVLA